MGEVGLLWGEGERQMPSLCIGTEGKQVILVRKTWNSLIVTTLGMGGKVDKGLVFPFLLSISHHAKFLFTQCHFT